MPVAMVDVMLKVYTVHNSALLITLTQDMSKKHFFVTK